MNILVPMVCFGLGLAFIGVCIGGVILAWVWAAKKIDFYL